MSSTLNNPIIEGLASLLDRHNAHYEIFRHENCVETAEEAAEYFAAEFAVPVFILKSEKGCFAVLKAKNSGTLSLKERSRYLNVLHLEITPPDEIPEATGFMAGTVPLIGHGLPTIFDKTLLRHEYIYGATGDPFHTLKIPPNYAFEINDSIIALGQ